MKLLKLFLFLVALLAASADAAELPVGFIQETLATNLNAATAIAPLPDGRILIAEQTGRLLVWKSGRVYDQPALDLSARVDTFWERGLIGVTVAPDFPRTPNLFVLYVARSPFTHHVLSRFTLKGDVADAASEMILLEGDDQKLLGGSQPGGHQGGPVRFGPDGKLYVSLGEQTAGEPAQKLTSLQGKILRLNADGSIPDDNPFGARTTGKYRAIYALGVRNSFGLAVQSRADGGRMFFTDVGGSAFEEVNELKPGANYGWPRAEGFSTNAAFTHPLHAYPPVIGQSIVGGVFLPKSGGATWPAKWRGKFLFADFMKHWIKALDPDEPTDVLTLAKGFNGPVAIELASDGSLLVFNRGAIWRDPRKFVPNAGSLVRIRYVGSAAAKGAASPATNRRAALDLPMQLGAMPKKLTRQLWESLGRPRPGERGFGLPTLEWHPEVEEESIFTLPEGGKLKLDADGRLKFPAGTVFIRNFLAYLHPGFRPPVQPMETRVVVVQSENAAFGCSYRWSNLREAKLVEDGEFISLPVMTEAGEPRKIHWWFPAQEASLSLGAVAPPYVIPQRPSELNLPTDKPGWTLLDRFVQEGLFDPVPDPQGIRALPVMAHWMDETAPLEARVRSYLHGNCAVCHQPGGASRGNLDARFSTPLDKTGMIDGELAAGDLGIAGAKIVVPGAPEKSILYRRLKSTDFFRMPPVQYHNEPSPILPLLEKWIRELKTP